MTFQHDFVAGLPMRRHVCAALPGSFTWADKIRRLAGISDPSKAHAPWQEMDVGAGSDSKDDASWNLEGFWKKFILACFRANPDTVWRSSVRDVSFVINIRSAFDFLVSYLLEFQCVDWDAEPQDLTCRFLPRQGLTWSGSGNQICVIGSFGQHRETQAAPAAVLLLRKSEA
jgi:hypothetical protein